MTSWYLTHALALILLPPGSLILLMGAGMMLLPTRPRLARGLLFAAVAALYVCAIPFTAHLLLQQWEGKPVAPVTTSGAQAIIVLGGGKYPHGPEFGGDTVAEGTLVRVRYAAWLQRQTGLPILVSGGNPDGGSIDEAQAMHRVLEREFAVPVRWTEGISANTLENARQSHRLLAPQGISTVYLVTHAWHMPRAQLAFEHAGFQVIPAATAYTTRYRVTILDFLPNARALHDSARFCHEVMGILWYRVRLLASA